MKIKAPFTIETPLLLKRYGQIPGSRFWYVWDASHRRVTQILTWYSSDLTHVRAKGTILQTRA